MQSFDISPEELQVFLQEAEELLQVLEDGLVRLEREPTAHELLHEVFRAAHTLKGSAATIGLIAMAELTHAMETVLDQLRHGQRTPDRNTIDALLKAVDQLRVLLPAAGGSPGDSQASQVADLISRLQIAGDAVDRTIALPSTTTETPQRAAAEGADIRVVVQPAASAWSGIRALQALLALEALGQVVDLKPSRSALEAGDPVERLEVRLQTPASPAEVIAALDKVPEIEDVNLYTEGVSTDGPSVTSSEDDQSPHSTDTDAPTGGGTSEQVHVSRTVRVDVARLDNLMALVGELVVARNRLAQLAQQMEAEMPGATLMDGLAETTQHLERVTDQLQEEVMKSRLLPIRPIFQRLPRLVRDLATRLNKQIDLQVSGEGTQLDRSIIEEIADPILHLVRNAVDHGIEPPAERRQQGKPSAGRLTVSAAQREGWVMVTVEEDGRGIDVDRVRAKAVAAGLLTADQAAHLDDTEAIQLIFAPGLSTASEVSDISGRGVGMDVVRTNIERLNGSVTVETWPGRGTRFTLRLPLTLAITRALLVTVGPTIYAIPMSNVGEAVRIASREIHAVGQNEAIVLRGQTLPLLRLSRIFGLPTVRTDDDVLVVTVQAGSRFIGLVVDRLLGTQELVVKPLSVMERQIQALVGATTLGDGRIALILDPSQIGREVGTSAQSLGPLQLAASH